jgi:hypothetical protein
MAGPGPIVAHSIARRLPPVPANESCWQARVVHARGTVAIAGASLAHPINR